MQEIFLKNGENLENVRCYGAFEEKMIGSWMKKR